MLFVGALVWGVLVLQVTAKNFDEYCEDWGICNPGDPVLSTVQAVVAAAGLFAVMGIATRLLYYAVGEGPPENLGRRVIVFAVSFAGWLALAEALSGWRG